MVGDPLTNDKVGQLEEFRRTFFVRQTHSPSVKGGYPRLKIILLHVSSPADVAEATGGGGKGG